MMSWRAQCWIGEGSWKRKPCARAGMAISVSVCWTLQLSGSSASAVVYEVETPLPVTALTEAPRIPAYV